MSGVAPRMHTPLDAAYSCSACCDNTEHASTLAGNQLNSCYHVVHAPPHLLAERNEPLLLLHAAHRHGGRLRLLAGQRPRSPRDCLRIDAGGLAGQKVQVRDCKQRLGVSCQGAVNLIAARKTSASSAVAGTY